MLNSFLPYNVINSSIREDARPFGEWKDDRGGCEDDGYGRGVNRRGDTESTT